MKIQNRITNLLNIKYPIIQAGMVWVSGHKLASAVSNEGGVGIIGAGSMKPDLLTEHIYKCNSKTKNLFGVNIPLLRGDAEDLIDTCINNNVRLIITSAGHPGKYADKIKSKNIILFHVVSNVKQAKKAEEVGCDAVVAEGVEAGGHNGADEITTLCLIPQVVNDIKIPVIAAGGIAAGSQIAACFCLGAEAVQIGTLFAAALESSAHIDYKNAIVNAKDNDTTLIMRKIGLIRLIKNEFSKKAIEIEKECNDVEKLKELLSSKREYKGISLGDLHEGALEAGQSAGLVNSNLSVKEIFSKLIAEFDNTINSLSKCN